MSIDPSDIAAKIDQLDTPDEPTQRDIRRFLIENAAPHIDVLTANLSVTEGRTRRGLVRVLVKMGDSRALLPLMRFIHDTAGERAESDARAIAARHLDSLAEAGDRGRLFDFLMDIRRDEDPFVRGYAIEGLGELRDPRARPFVRDARDDDHEFVRDRAASALEKLRNAHERVTDDAPERADLERKIRTASGARLRFLVEELVRHEQGFEIARDLLFEDGSHVMVAVQALRRIQDPRARDVARTFLDQSPADSERAAALRLLADCIQGDASDRERDIVRAALDDNDIFVRLAGLEAAARSGDRELVLDVIDRAVDDGLDGIETVAEGLAQGKLTADEEVAARIFELLEKVRLEMRHSDGTTWTMSAAYLLRSLKRAAPRDWQRNDEAIEMALGAMRDRPQIRPIAVTALELLVELVPSEGLARNRRWHPDDIDLLIRASNAHGDDLLPRVLEVVARTASPSKHDLGGWFERIAERLDSTDAQVRLARAIREVRPDNAEALLPKLIDAGGPETKKAAEAALRRVRNDRGIIDVDFRRASESAQDSSD